MAARHAVVQGFPEAAGPGGGHAHGREDEAAGQPSGEAAGREEGEGPFGREARGQPAEGRCLERQREEEGRAAEGAQPGILHDFKPSGRGRFHDEAVAAVSHAVEMQPSGEHDPREAAERAAEGRRQDKRGEADAEGGKGPDDDPHGGKPRGHPLERWRQGRGTDGQAGKETEGGAKFHDKPLCGGSPAERKPWFGAAGMV